MPVVKCKKDVCQKQYEIEKDEMIFTLPNTKKVEDLVKKEDYTSLGLFVKEQVLTNTHSFTNKFQELNNFKESNETIFAKN